MEADYLGDDKVTCFRFRIPTHQKKEAIKLLQRSLRSQINISRVKSICLGKGKEEKRGLDGEINVYHRLLCSYVYVTDHSSHGAERMALDGGRSE